MFFWYIRFSYWLCKYVVMILEKLMEGFEKCYILILVSIWIFMVFNIIEWFILYFNIIKNYFKLYSFKIVKDDNGRVRFFWKEWFIDKVCVVKLEMLINVVIGWVYYFIWIVLFNM